MLQNVQRFNNLRGGLTPAASNVLYVHGQFDPWRSIGVQQSEMPNTSSIVVIGKKMIFDFRVEYNVHLLIILIFCRSFTR